MIEIIKKRIEFLKKQSQTFYIKDCIKFNEQLLKNLSKDNTEG